MKIDDGINIHRRSGVSINFEVAFEAMPGCSALLATDTPVYTILATTYDYLQLSSKTKEDIVGKGLFEAFPKSPVEPDFTGEQNLNASFQQVIASKLLHQLPVQRYDIPNTDGTFSEFYWRATNKPVLDTTGKVLYIIHTAENITDKIQAEQQQKIIKGMEQAHDLFMQTPVAIGILKGPSLIVELANEHLTDIWGKGKDVKGKPLLEVIPEVNSQGFIELLYEVIETGISYKAYERPITFIKDGKEDTGYFNFIYKPYYELNIQEPVGVLLFINEVTERITIKNELAQKDKSLTLAVKEKQKLITLVEVSNEFIGIAAPDHTVEYCNQAALRMLGWDNITGRTIIDCVYPEDRALANQLLLKHLKIHHFSHEIRFRNEKTGEPFWLQWNAFTLRDPKTGELTGSATVSSNITERKQTENALQESERFYRTLMEEATVAITLFTGPQMVVEYANSIMIGYWGKDSAVIGKPLIEIVPELIGQPFVDLIQNVYKTGETYYGHEEKVNLIVNGKLQSFYFNYTYKAVRNKAGEIYGVHEMAIDVTSQVLAKKALEETEQNLRNIIRQAPVAMCIVKGPDYIVEIANGRMLELWGKSAEVMINKPIFEGLPEAKEQGLEPVIQHVYRTGETFKAFDRPVYLPHAGKIELMYLNFVFEPFFEKDGTVSGIMAIAINVTHQVLTRQKIEKSERDFRQLANALPEMVWETDQTGQQTFASERWKEYTGLNTQDATTFTQSVHPDDLDALMQEWSVSLATGKLYKTQARVKSKEGEYRWHFVHGEPIRDEENRIIRWIGAYVDVHDQKITAEMLRQSDENFRQLANLVPQIIWTSKPDGCRDYYNKRWYDYTGFEEGCGDQSWMPILHPDDVQLCTDNWRHSVKTGDPYQAEYRFLDRTGRYRWFLGKALPIRDNNGVITKWFGTCTDIQEIKEQQEQKDYFISLASHELKTPVTSIKGYVQVLQRKYHQHTDEFLSSALDTVNKQINKMSRLISDLLDVPKINSGKLSLHKEEFSVSQLIEEVVEQINYISSAYHISISKATAATIYGDRERIGQVISNLLTNAVKYSPLLKKVIVESSDVDGKVMISVTDYGIGISLKDQDKIFDRFYRVDGQNEKTYPGFGIGLFIASEIIERHHGKIGVKSELGKGAVFYFSLPVFRNIENRIPELV